MTTLADLLKLFDDDEIIVKLVELYPKEEESEVGYSQALRSLRTITPQITVADPLRIEVEFMEKDPTHRKEAYYDVSGVSSQGEFLAIDYMAWAKWLGSPIVGKSFAKTSKLDVLCHCLWEMTWSGFEEVKIQARFQDLIGRAEEARVAVGSPPAKLRLS